MSSMKWWLYMSNVFHLRWKCFSYFTCEWLLWSPKNKRNINGFFYTITRWHSLVLVTLMCFSWEKTAADHSQFTLAANLVTWQLCSHVALSLNRIVCRQQQPFHISYFSKSHLSIDMCGSNMSCHSDVIPCHSTSQLTSDNLIMQYILNK